MKPTTQNEPVAQGQLVEILCLEEEIRMIRADIRRAKRKIADAMVSGAAVQSGCHQAKLDKHGRVKVVPWRGAIMRYTLEEWEEREKASTTVRQTVKKASAKSLLLLAPRSPEEQIPVA